MEDFTMGEALVEAVAAVERFTDEYGVTPTVAAAAASLSTIQTLDALVEVGVLTREQAHAALSALGMGTAMLCLAHRAQAESDWQGFNV